ncbi:MAG TPA: hypothetical protein DEW35_00190 [Ruminococcaceae bacterium]|nr:hypothetical protein [Oscillospiraceae bacterium]
MATDTTVSYKCPACGSPLTYNPNGKLVCAACSNEFDIEAVQKFAEAETEGKGFDWGDYKKEFSAGAEKLENTAVYVCKFCGAAIETDGTAAATHCPYCDNELILNDQLSGSVKPNAIIPFEIDKNAAMQAVKNHFKGKVLLPKDFASNHKLSKITGVYVPFWLFDSRIDGNANINAKNIRYYSDSKYNYTETQHYLVTVDGAMKFSKIPVDGSEKMDDDLMDALEPFDYSSLKEFNPAFLSGFLADRFDEDPDESLPRASDRMETSARQVFLDCASEFDTANIKSSNFSLVDPSVKYALLPVYLLNLSYKEQNYRFAVNGQTGKVVGELPISKFKSFIQFGSFFAGAAAIAGIIAYFVMGW